MKIPVIIDCDPGLDDVIALLMALKNEKLDIRAITAVGGNQSLEIVGKNILKLLSFVGLEVPVGFGEAGPLKRQLFMASDVHGHDGLYGIEIPNTKLKAEEIHGVDLMAKIIKSSKEKITIIGLGPLTNIAMLLMKYPEVRDNIERIHFMGGAICGGNVTKNAEFNIFVDPEAGDVVFKSKIPLSMCGLDVTEKAYLTLEEIARIKAINNHIGKFAGKILESLSIYHKGDGLDGCHLHDPVAIISVTNPEIIKTMAMEVEVDTHGKPTRGMTLGNFSKRFNKNPNMEVALDINRERFMEILIEEIEKY